MIAVTYRRPCLGLSARRFRLTRQVLHEPQAANVKQILGANRAQAKLKIGPVNDQFEQEADRIADQVVSGGHAAGAVRHTEGVNGTQRMCEDCEEELQLKPKRNASIDTTNETRSVMNHRLNAGRKLPASQRIFFESRMGYGFENVRIHSDEQAARSADVINARAYTLGRDIVFNKGEYRPGTLEGDRLLAHELTHVLQQHK